MKREGEIDIFSEVRAVVNSSSFWAAICVSPFVFGATFVAIGSSPGDASSLLLAFQNGFFWESIFARLLPSGNAPQTPPSSSDKPAEGLAPDHN